MSREIAPQERQCRLSSSNYRFLERKWKILYRKEGLSTFCNVVSASQYIFHFLSINQCTVIHKYVVFKIKFLKNKSKKISHLLEILKLVTYILLIEYIVFPTALQCYFVQTSTICWSPIYCSTVLYEQSYS